MQTTDRAVHWGLGIGGVLIAAALLWPGLFLKKAASAQSDTIPKKWEFTAGGAITGALALADDGTLYAASEDGFVYALYPSGEVQWKFDADRTVVGPTISTDGKIYVTNAEEHIYAINRAGSQVWTSPGGHYIGKQMGSIAAAIDQIHLYTPWHQPLVAAQLIDGTIDWSAGRDFQEGGSVSILSNGLLVYPGDGAIHAVDTTGRQQWQYPAIDTSSSGGMNSQRGLLPFSKMIRLDSGIAVGYDSSIYVCVVDSRLDAIGPGGNFKWEFKTKTSSVNKGTPVIASDGTIYFGTDGGTLYAINPDGTQKWSLDTGGAIAATAVLAEDETVYVANGLALFAVSPDGKVLAKAPISGGVDSSPTLAPDGTIYVATNRGQIIAFAGTHGGLMKSSWPKFQGDLANSGRAVSF
jgi:outer membrane protein assembly factor BamB